MDISSVSSNPFRQYVSAYKEKTEVVSEKTVDLSSDVNNAVNDVSNVVTDGISDGISGTEKIIDFTYGLLGIDQVENDPQEVSSNDEQGDGLYKLGQYIKAAGTVGTFVSFLI
ncbi:hypothetical protein SAMN05660420_01585 [Desulfuromusa kysingii]|uniref:Uncharacterized protein n=1 Tax=Desulfuromusa kysingii TaxID=37625 RepID=A0A1H3ZM12_9BACT|nr:hypothetical protein [Desulfuromusa kysingii]SEA24688.1 hypothetical protein SAMN05660420_01585 [Desulfuromusa kysingii]